LCLAALSLPFLNVPARAGDEFERTFESENFTLTWTTEEGSPDAPDPTDGDGDGVPESVELTVQAFEDARAFLLSELGYRDANEGDRYPLYAAAIASGYTQSLPEDSGSRSSFIVFPVGLMRPAADDTERRALAIHEYFHAIQAVYDADEDHWIKEATAAWVQDVWLDDGDTPHYFLDGFLPYPRLPLDHIDGRHEYGAFLFIQFLTERYGGGSVAGTVLVRELWELMAVPEAVPNSQNLDSFGAIAEVLARRGATFEEAWGEFMLWRRRLSLFEEGRAYRRAVVRKPATGGLLRASRVRSESCRLDTDLDLLPLRPLASDYVLLRPHPRGPNSVLADLVVEGPPGATGFYSLKSTSGSDVTSLHFDETGVARAIVPFGSATVEGLTLGLGHGLPGAAPSTLAYSLRLQGTNRVSGSLSAARSVEYGSAIAVGGQVSCRSEPAPFADVLVTETEVVGGETTTFATQTNGFGSWSVLRTPESNVVYTAEVVDPLLSQATTNSTDVGVRVAMTIEVPEPEVTLGSGTPVRGMLTPAHPGTMVLIEYRRPSGDWRRGPEVIVDAAGRYDTTIVLPRSGVWEVRASMVSTGDDDHLPGMTGTRFVRVKEG
jgi:hypothetical protein